MEGVEKCHLRALAAADEQIKRQRMKNLANKDEILETARQRVSVDQKTEQTMKKQKTSIKFWTFPQYCMIHQHVVK